MILKLKNIYCDNEDVLIKENINEQYASKIKNNLLRAKKNNSINENKKNTRANLNSGAEINLYSELLNVDIKTVANNFSGCFFLKPNFEIAHFKENKFDQDTYLLIKKILLSNKNKLKENVFYSGNIRASILNEVCYLNGINYLQIENLGLFHLKNNFNFMPNDLPQLDGNIQFKLKIEPVTILQKNKQAIKSLLKIEYCFRPLNCPKLSPYTIDTEDGIEFLISSIKIKKSNK